MRRFFTTALAFASLPLFPGCADYSMSEQDVDLSLDEETAEVRISFESRGLFPEDPRWGESKEEATRRAGERLSQAAAGARYLHFLDWPFIVDLDAAVETRKGAAAPFLKTLDELVQVQASSAFVDSAGEAGLRQTFRLADAERCLAAVNGLISLSVREELAAQPMSKAVIDEPYESEASRENLRSFLDAGEPWITLDGDALEVQVPLTPGDLAVLLRNVAFEGQPDSPDPRGRSLVRGLLEGLTELKVQGDVVTLRWAAGADGVIPFRYRGSGSSGAASLAPYAEPQVPAVPSGR